LRLRWPDPTDEPWRGASWSSRRGQGQHAPWWFVGGHYVHEGATVKAA